MEKYIDFHRRHPHCTTPRLNATLPLEEGETAARLVDPELPGMSFTEVRHRPPPLGQEFIPKDLGRDADIDEVSTVAMVHEQLSVLSYLEEHDDPWYQMSVKDQLEQSHCDGSHTTVKWKRKRPPPMSEFDRQLAWQMNMYGNYAGGAPPMSAAQIDNIANIALKDKSLLHPHLNRKRVSPWAKDYQWSRFTAAGDALDDFKRNNRNKDVDEALAAYANETAMALKSQKISQRKSIKSTKSSDAAISALAKNLLAEGVDKFMNFSSNVSVSSGSTVSLLLPSQPFIPNTPAVSENINGEKETSEEVRNSMEVFPFNPTLDAQTTDATFQQNAQIYTKDGTDEKTSSKKKKKRKNKNKKGGLFTKRHEDEDDSDNDEEEDEDMDDFELFDDYDRMKRQIGGDAVADSIADQLQKLAIQATRAAKVRKKFVDTSLDFFEACDKLRVVKVISLLMAGKGDPNMITSEDEPLFIHCLNKLLRFDQISSSLHPEEKHRESSDRKKLQRILDALVQHGADVNTDQGREGQRPVHLVAASNNTKVMFWLSTLSKVDMEAWSPRDQWTPLIVATRYAHIEMMAMLLRHGVAIDGVDALKYTALHHAAKQGHTRAAMFLLRVGANKMLRTIDGHTAAGVAQDGNFLVCSQGIASYAVPIVSPAEQLQHLVDLEAAKSIKKPIQLRDLGGLLSKQLVCGYDAMAGDSGQWWKRFKKMVFGWWRGDAPIEGMEDDEAFLKDLEEAEEAASLKLDSAEDSNGNAVTDSATTGDAVLPF